MSDTSSEFGARCSSATLLYFEPKVGIVVTTECPSLEFAMGPKLN